jgi:signal transduction histidine kinase
MYRLFEIDRDTPISPEIYLKYTTEAGRSAAERVVKHIHAGDTNFEETLEIKVSGKTKIIHLKATVVSNNQGRPVKVLGVDMDVTALRVAEERIRKMEAEQQLEIFRVSLSTLEEERRRIAESLHNGIGQLLYGVKISLSGLIPDMPASEFRETKSYTSAILSDAIKETRRVSHELMPTTLEEFGLASAIEDICHQLRDGVKFKCTVEGLKGRLEKYLELAIYRTTQELMINVVKHARATKATVNLTVISGQITIRVSDNGQGKIKLLNGKVNIQSGAGGGTTVEVIIPMNAA